MPRLTAEFTADEIGLIQDAVMEVADLAEREGRTEDEEKLNTVTEKLGHWS